MFEIRVNDNNEIFLAGRLDASQVKRARVIFDTLEESTTIDFRDLEYISSAGLGVLVETYKRLRLKERKLKLTNLSQHLKTIFQISGLDRVFEIS
jgi:anti-anti-sigma factor